MRKIWSELKNQLGLEPWDYEIALRTERGMPEHEAKHLVIMRWMKAGDFRPMLAAIKKDGMLRGPALGLLAQMLKTGELAFKKKGRGRRFDPEADIRNEYAADAYEDLRKDPEVSQVRSDDLLDATGKAFGVSEESARRALTNRRKSKSSGST
jgi:hypothetical protein